MKLFKPVLFCLAALLPLSLSAQEGYPLDGTWRGEWGQSGGEGTLAVVVMGWDVLQREGEIIVIEGVLADLGSYHRTLTGTWTSGGVENQLVLARE